MRPARIIDFVLYPHEGALVAQRLDTSAGLIGPPVTVTREVALDGLNGITAVSTSTAGTITYRSRAPARQLRWFIPAAATQRRILRRQPGLGGGPGA
jgi:hypothetical protein